MAKHLIPPDRIGRILSILILVLPITTWIARAAINQYRYDLWVEGGGLYTAFSMMILCPLFILAIGIVLLLFVLILKYTLGKNRHPLPVIGLVGFVFSLLIPLPLLPPLPEELSFPIDRAAYEQVVELARQRQLAHDNTCRSEIAFVLPSEYGHLLETECLKVYYSSGLVVEFRFGRTNRYIVYAETEEDLLDSFACHGDGGVAETLDEHWYICVQDSL